MSHYIPIKHHKRPWNYHDTPICEATGGCPLTRWHADACIVVHVENFKRLTATGTLHWVTNWTFHKNWALSSNQQPPSSVTTTSSQLRTPINSLCLLLESLLPSHLIVLPQPFSADGSQILLCKQPAEASGSAKTATCNRFLLFSMSRRVTNYTAGLCGKSI